MTKDFAADLAVRLQSHAAFWEDLQSLQVAGVRCSLGSELFPPSEVRDSHLTSSGLLQRMLYCASIFAQTSDEHHKGKPPFGHSIDRDRADG